MTNKKKVLYIHHGKGLGGAPLSLLYLINNIDKTKYEPIVLFLHDSPAVTLYKNYKIPIAGIVNRYDFSHTKIWWQRWYHLPRIAKITYDTFITLHKEAPYWFNRLKPDLIHLNTSSLIAWGKAAHKLGIPIIWHIREPLAAGYLGLRKNIIRYHVKNYASAIIAISKHDATPWQKDPKTNIIHNAVDKSIFDNTIETNSLAKKLFLNHHDPKILFLGGLSLEKGTLVIFKAFKNLLTIMPHAKLLVAGYFTTEDITQPTLYRKLSPSFAFYKKVNSIYQTIKHAIRILGPITYVPQAMNLCNVIVFPATVGHFARPIIEAGFMKKPVIASNLPPLNELVINKKTGYLVNPDNTQKWTNTLYKLLNNKNLSSKLGENAYNYCKNNFDIQSHIKKIEKIYQQLLYK